MPLRLAFSVFVVVALGLLPAPARAQQLVPVDQTVGDADALARSLRRVDSGLGIQGQQAALYQVVPGPGMPAAGVGAAPVYYRIGQGYRATFSRLDYLVRLRDGTLSYDVNPRKDGQYVEVIPANTVFDLRPYNPRLFLAAPNYRAVSPATQPAAAANAAQHGVTPVTIHRIEPARVDNRIDTPKLSATPAQR